jgi:hypothetical protein
MYQQMDQQQNGAMPSHRRFSRFHDNQPPGNEPGGANGMYGRFGQHPDQQPSQDFDNQVESQRRGFGRYGAQSQMRMGDQVAPESMMTAQPAQQDSQPQQPMDDHTPNQPADGGLYSGANGMGSYGSADATQSDNSSPMPSQQQPPATQVSQPQAPPQPGPTPVASTPSSSGSSFASPFGNMNFGGASKPTSASAPTAYAKGGIVTKPTLALIGEHEPEMVVPLNGGPNAKLMPSMMQPRDTFQTGTTSLHHPMHSLKPTSGPMSHAWKRFGKV